MTNTAVREDATRPFAPAFVRYAETRPHVVCVNGDLTASAEADEFRARFPDRFFALGMAEQNLIGVAAGLAREGLMPFYPTFSVFGTRRPYEQIAMSVAFPRLPVRIIGFLPGLTTPGGVTHQAIDDVGLMRLLPNMTVLDLGDATEIETVWPTFDAVQGPIFCRMLRGVVPRLFGTPFEFGRMRLLSGGNEVLVLSAGAATQWTATAVGSLINAGIDVGHGHVSTLKPFDDPILEDRVRQARHGIVTVENHLVDGGLGSAVASLIAERGFGKRLVRIGLRDTYARGGTLPYLLDRYGLSASNIVRAVESLVGRQDEMSDVAARTAATHTLAAEVAEGL
jgi:transketolase